jgi:cell division protein FtsX
MLPSMASLPIQRSIRRGWKSLRRERRWGSTLLMLCVSMTLLQMLIAGLLSMRGIESLFTAQSGIHLEVMRGAQDQDIQELYAALKALPYVEQVEYVPKEKAYEREKLRDPALIDSLEKFAVSNPFPDTFSVSLMSLESFDELLAFVEQPQWKGVIDPTFLTTASTQEREVRSYLSVAQSVMRLGYIVLWMGIVALLVIVADIALQRAYERRSELMLETAMGASPMQVLMPLAAEIGILLIASLVVGFIVTVLFLLILPLLIPGLAPGGTFAEARSYIVPLLVFVFPLLIIGQALLLPLVGIAGGIVGTGRLRMLRS